MRLYRSFYQTNKMFKGVGLTARAGCCMWKVTILGHPNSVAFMYSPLAVKSTLIINEFRQTSNHWIAEIKADFAK